MKGRIVAAGKELKAQETTLWALRRGDVAIRSGQPLWIDKVTLQNPSQSKEVIQALLNKANEVASILVLPGQSPKRDMLQVRGIDISKLENAFSKPGSSVVSILSAGNVLRGESYVRAFMDVRPNRLVVRQGEQMASGILGADERSPQEVENRLNQLLDSSFSRAQSQGSLADRVKYFDPGSWARLIKLFSERPSGQTLRLESFSQRDSDIADPLVVDIRWQPAPGNGQAAAGAGRNQP